MKNIKTKLNRIYLKRLTYRLRHDYLTMNNIVIAVAFLIAGSWAWGSIEAMQQNYAMQRSLDTKRQQVKIDRLKLTLLEYESRYYQSDEYQELAVRQRLGKGLPGEKQLILASTDDNSQPITNQQATPTQPDSNIQQWTNFLFGGGRRK